MGAGGADGVPQGGPPGGGLLTNPGIRVNYRFRDQIREGSQGSAGRGPLRPCPRAAGHAVRSPNARPGASPAPGSAEAELRLHGRLPVPERPPSRPQGRPRGPPDTGPGSGPLGHPGRDTARPRLGYFFYAPDSIFWMPMKKSLIFVLVPLIAVLALGSLNVSRKARWRDITDGIVWKADENGLRAVVVDPASEAFLRAGIRKGDVLTAINKIPVRTKADVLKNLWQAAATDQSVTYDINKEGMQIYPTFYPQKKAVNPIYYYLVLVGLMTLAIGLVVYFNSHGLMSLPYIFFYLLALSFAT